MNGVEILSLEIIYNTIWPGWCATLGLAVGLILAVPMSICLAHEKWICGLLAFIAVLGCMGMIYLGTTDNENDINYIEYKVTIDDSVSMKAFLDKYEILEQEGKIYTVKETTQND